MDYRAVLQELTWTRTILTLLSATITYSVTCVLYNAFLHPLRGFPGPKLAGATGLYLGFYKFHGETHVVVKRLHDEYGPVVRVGPNQLSFIEETAWKDIYAYRGKDRSQMQKGDKRGPGPKGPYHIINAPDDVHARQRKILSSSFSDRALRDNQSLLIGYTEDVATRIREHAATKTPIDIAKYVEFYTSDIISDFCFTESYGQLKAREQEPVIAAIHKFIPIEAKISILPAPLAFFILLQILGRNQIRMLAKAEQQIKTRLQKNIDKKDVMHQLISHISEDGNGITFRELSLNTLILMLAGSETTATALAGAFYYVLKNKHVLRKLTEEIRGCFNSTHEITLDKLARLPYLNAVIEESLRLYSPVPAALSRVTPPGGASISGHWIPGNTTVGIPHFAAFRSARNFADPDAFHPERWLPNRPVEFETDRRAAFQPFSAGPRNCLGMNLAYAELRLLLGRLFYEFNFALVDEESRWDDQKAYMLYRKPPLMLHVAPRL
ncbi:uncharacterized protein PV09_01369 [Verruconis gallopava]|uniref:Cytochrome P450 n=1 Tax=Verruconis gallopava TaxID=253628 RepID=A0A0D1Y0A0_9PEZI|nr:uncharacterized protein PV09_01369 [Verruconis gallopava]KIW08466.1 hypothetical protein PV09_01369 [Verruconis gallopava]